MLNVFADRSVGTDIFKVSRAQPITKIIELLYCLIDDLIDASCLEKTLRVESVEFGIPIEPLGLDLLPLIAPFFFDCNLLDRLKKVE